MNSDGPHREALRRDVTMRILRITTKAGLTIDEVADIHFQCLLSLAIEAAEGNQFKAAELLKPCLDQLVEQLRTGQMEFSEVIVKGEDLH